MSEILLMRHAKSDWHIHVDDLDRPLNKRGRRDAVKIAEALEKLGCVPDYIVVSPARRTQETVERMVSRWSASKPQVSTDDELYMASGETITELAAAYVSSAKRLMLVAHNPGIDSAVSQLAKEPPELSASGKLMVTAAVAHFDCKDPSALEKSRKCQLVRLLRPKDLY